MSRTRNSIRNVSYAIMGQLALIVIGFVARKIFIHYLPIEYLGLNGLFASILTVLSLAELGLGPAMVFSLYKPLAERNDNLTISLMTLYKKAYRYIGIIVLVAGLIIAPFIPRIIKTIPDNVSNIVLIFVLFVINSSISYFYSYKRSFIIASQNQYRIDLVHMMMYFLMNCAQILALIFSGSFLLFLGIQILSTFIENAILTNWVNREYPWIEGKSDTRIPRDIQGQIVKNIKAMVFHRVGGIVVDATDSILISSFFGLSFLSLYSNYLLVISALKSITQSFFTGITAPIGDFGARGDPAAAFALYRRIQFFNFWLSTTTSICFFVLINPFIELIWLGDEYTIHLSILFVITLNFYLNSMRRTVLTFKEAFGLPWHDRYKPLVAAVSNLLLSIVLAERFGVIGVFLGTMLTNVFVNIWVEAWVVYKYGFAKTLSPFLVEYLQYALVFAISMTSTVLIASKVDFHSYLGFAWKTVLCILVPNGLITAMYRKSDEFQFVVGLLKTLFQRLKR